MFGNRKRTGRESRRTRRLWVESLEARTLLSAAKAPPADDYGNDFASAFALRLDSSGYVSVNGKIETGSDIDMFQLGALADGKMTVTMNTTGGKLTPRLTLWNGSQATPASGKSIATASLDVPQGRTYFIQAAGARTTGSYSYSDNFVDRPLWVDGPQYNDIDQGSLGDCYFLAGLSGLAQTDPNLVTQSITNCITTRRLR